LCAVEPALTPSPDSLAMAGDLKTLVVNASESGVFHVELARPAAQNAMNWDFWNEMKQVFDGLANNSDCRAIVLSARGKGFSAGLDVSDPRNIPARGEDVARTGLKFISHLTIMQDACTAVENCMKPTIAVVHGACVGAGIDLITACDIRICSADAYYSIREVAVGLAADVGTLARLPKIVGNESVVRELALTARDFTSEEARSMGLVSRVHPTLEEAMKDAQAVAQRIAALSPVAVAGTKKNLNFARDHTVADSLDYVRSWNACMLQTDDFTKALAAAMKKTKPTFSKL